eukprot:s3120_g2.t1
MAEQEAIGLLEQLARDFNVRHPRKLFQIARREFPDRRDLTSARAAAALRSDVARQILAPKLRSLGKSAAEAERPAASGPGGFISEHERAAQSFEHPVATGPPSRHGAGWAGSEESHECPAFVQLRDHLEGHSRSLITDFDWTRQVGVPLSQVIVWRGPSVDHSPYVGARDQGVEDSLGLASMLRPLIEKLLKKRPLRRLSLPMTRLLRLRGVFVTPWSDPIVGYDDLVARAGGSDAMVRAVALVDVEQKETLTSL